MIKCERGDFSRFGDQFKKLKFDTGLLTINTNRELKFFGFKEETLVQMNQQTVILTDEPNVIDMYELDSTVILSSD